MIQKLVTTIGCAAAATGSIAAAAAVWLCNIIVRRVFDFPWTQHKRVLDRPSITNYHSIIIRSSWGSSSSSEYLGYLCPLILLLLFGYRFFSLIYPPKVNICSQAAAAEIITNSLSTTKRLIKYESRIIWRKGTACLLWMGCYNRISNSSAGGRSINRTHDGDWYRCGSENRSPVKGTVSGWLKKHLKLF